MSKKQFAILLVVVALAGMLGGSLSDRLKGRPAYADLTWPEALKPYKVPFKDWVVAYLHATEACSTDHYWVQVGAKSTADKRVKFTITGYAVDSPIGRKWYEGKGSKIVESVAMSCSLWTQQGYPISLADFDIDIQKQW